MNALKTLSLSLLLALPLTVAAAQRPATPFTDAEIDQLLAPIALYPDTVLSHVLIAATVPEDVEAAAHWIDRHPDRRGQEAVDAVERYDWDPSVKALVAFPEILERMAEDPDWTDDLGLAFLEQEAVVMDRVQVLRDRAYDNGSLDDLEHVRVVREREYIYIEPAVSRVVYVPYYDPWVVYGHWWWPSYPPHRWTFWAGYPVRHYYGSSFYWGVSYHLGPRWYASSFNWPHRHVVVTRPHRHYAPSPGYSGRSSMRRDTVAHRDSRSGRHGDWRHDSPGRPDAPGHSGGHRRDGTPVRRGHERHDEGDTHVPQGHRSSRRDWTEVRAGLTARREASRAGAGTPRAAAAHRSDRPARGQFARADGAPRRSESPGRSVRSDVRGRPEGRRTEATVRSPEPRQARPEVRSEPAPSRESRPAVSDGSRSESRGGSVESRSESRGGGESRSGGEMRGGHGRGNGGGGRMRSR